MSQILPKCAYLFVVLMNEFLTTIVEFLELILMMDTIAACDIFCSLITALYKAGVEWSRAVSLAVDGAKLMVGRNTGVATK